jgi:hypothetical protein
MKYLYMNNIFFNQLFTWVNSLILLNIISSNMKYMYNIERGSTAAGNGRDSLGTAPVLRLERWVRPSQCISLLPAVPGFYFDRASAALSAFSVELEQFQSCCIPVRVEQAFRPAVCR